MVRIKDLEEKKRIIAFYKCLYNKHPENKFYNSKIYDVWLRMWRNDFVVDGKCLKMWHQKFVVSANKDRQGIAPPEYYKEYNKFINNVTDWMNSNYEIKQGRKNNKKKYAEMLIEHRKICADKVAAQLKECINLSDCKLVYTLPEKTDKTFTELVSYALIHNGESIFKGSCDEIIEYMGKTDNLIAYKKNEGVVC